MKTQVAIIGGGPAGLLLSHVLDRAGIESVVLEKQTRDHVLGRIRAGVLEWGTVEFLRESGLGERMDREGHIRDGTAIGWQEQRLFIDCKAVTGKPFMAYGQTKIQEDLDAVRGHAVIEGAEDVRPHDVLTDAPYVTYAKDGVQQRVACEFVAGCDGFHGVSRSIIPGDVLTEYKHEYPFAWLGVLSETPPLPEIMYANHPTGFALASMRTPMLSRYYVQVPEGDDVEEWPDDRFWEALLQRFPRDVAERIITGPSIEKSIAPLRSYVAEPMRYGRLFLAGDAAHVVPPTGAKGLNLAVSDTYYLSRALIDHYQTGSTTGLDTYSATALRRVWDAVRFSWWLTELLHVFPRRGEFAQRIQYSELELLATSERFHAAVAEQYAGFPL